MKKAILIVFILLFIFLINSTVFATNETLVYVDKEKIDSKYHRLTCNSIVPYNYETITVEEAFNKGYRRCPICSPPLSDKEYNLKHEEADEIINSINPPSNKRRVSRK